MFPFKIFYFCYRKTGLISTASIRYLFGREQRLASGVYMTDMLYTDRTKLLIVDGPQPLVRFRQEISVSLTPILHQGYFELYIRQQFPRI